MKKFYFFIIAITMAGMIHAQDCSDLIISEYVEGWNNNKAIEIYNPTPNVIVYTDNYRLIRWSNGSTIADQDIQYVLPLVGEIQPYQVEVIIQDTNFPGQDTMVWAGLRAKATMLAPADYNAGTQGCRVVFWNGDDAISIQRKIDNMWVDIDIFGEIGVRPLNWQGTTSPAGAWTDEAPYWRGYGAYFTRNQTLIRKADIMLGIDLAKMNTYGQTSTGGFPNSFNAFNEYDSMPANFFDSLGFHTCKCQPVGISQTQKETLLQVFPNPVAGDQITVSFTEPMQSVELYDTPGQLLYSTRLTSADRKVVITLTPNMRGRILFLKALTAGNQAVIRKVVVL